MWTSVRLWRSSSWGQTSVATGTAVVAISYASCRGTKSDVRTKNEASKSHKKKSDKLQGLSPASPIYIFRPNDKLEIAFDTRTRNPLYVLEHITHRQPEQTTSANNTKLKRPNSFYEEKSLPEEFRSRPSHYKHSGFDRGHLACAGNYMHTTQKEVNDTFNLINISPQVNSMNSSIWSRLERWVQKIAQENYERNNNVDTFVVSGPLWMPAKKAGEKLFEFQYSGIGNPPALVSVPTHFFKIVVAVKESQIVKFACFVVPNQEFASPNKVKPKRLLEDFLVPWTAIEAVTGLHFFPSLTAALDWKESANKLTQSITKKAISAGNKQQPLLLTDGSATVEAGGRKKWGFAKSNNKLEHFCADGGCS
ncbi:Endonuclease G, mitochondrial [Seminavis robusta]|uniref:Endonuclease n=1 Tax=Seminavis robusta TaxID=568900 RepID=A0A9N8EHZ4_9STRA|nr:Endonuclease G, mitochondrial [Seminavis robusta]|eukprot:Sro1165_g248070.1 Endonuclease G, mitochondrial (365) ;mRNA; f:11054-12148